MLVNWLNLVLAGIAKTMTTINKIYIYRDHAEGGAEGALFCKNKNKLKISLKFWSPIQGFKQT